MSYYHDYLLVLNIFLLLFCFILLFLLVRPLYKKKFPERSHVLYDNIFDSKDVIINRTIEMVKSNKIEMSFSEESNDIYELLSLLKNKIIGNERNLDYQYFNFPRAFLILGIISKYKKNTKDDKLKKILEQACLKLINEKGELKFTFDKIDQSLFGCVFYEMYKITGNNKYKQGMQEIYIKVLEFSNEDDLILYRKKSNIMFTDTLGMVIPFIYMYSNIIDDKLVKAELNAFARKQIFAFIDKCYDKSNGLISHAYDLNNNIKLGSNNWSRGMGWFLIGLAYSCKFEIDENIKNRLASYYDKSMRTLNDLKINNAYWGQFLGHSYEYTIDTSATLMFYYANYIATGNINKKEFAISIHGCIDTNGRILHSSGDTFYINRYSVKKSSSEISQGLLTYLLLAS
ncbi:glycoside hydrolase family 88 protein [Photobacterium piscicola]|uniref:glycoside hydrolase family 88 protein n=1 Tax=Photobacterium piscicola TaxID=1378299 RepID=UPI002E197D31|nr:glycoside hydrolase family 88 protein [Photobacterium piscicola]